MAKPDIICGLDVGSGTLKAVACAKPKNEETFEVLASAQEPSFGIRKGIVVNPPEVTALLQSLFKKVGDATGRVVDSVYVNVGGSHIFSTQSRGLVSVSRADQKISQEDIERVLTAAQTFSLPLNREILEVFPREFIVDGEKGIRMPEGLKGVRLEAEVLVLGGFSPYLKNLTTAVLGAGLQINDLIFSPLAASRAVLQPREKELGVALLDIGAGTTGLSIFEEGDLVHLAILPIGSGHITSDIAVYLRGDIDMAERIKLEFGTLFFHGQDKKEKIKLSEGETLVFSPKQISRVIEDRVSEIFGEVNKELKRIGKAQQLPCGVVLTGGGSKLPKIKELAKKEFRLPCRLGQARGFAGGFQDPRFSTACGLVLMGAEWDVDRTAFRGSLARQGQGFGAKIKKIFKIFVP